NLGRRVSLTRGNGVVTTYAYDPASRLETLVHNAAGSAHDTSVEFDYNPASQITARTRTNPVYDWPLPAEHSESYVADGLNRYTSALGATPTYDAHGNLTNDGTQSYTYDLDNRLIGATGGVSLGYDPAAPLHEVKGAATPR